jgi:predicted nucleic acid-binding Zn ribbon protein
LESIKNIVSEVIGRMSCGPGGSPADIQAAWARVSKDKASRVADFKDGCLTITADSSMRLVRLNLNREFLLKELQKEFPTIKKISFKVG